MSVSEVVGKGTLGKDVMFFLYVFGGYELIFYLFLLLYCERKDKFLFMGKGWTRRKVWWYFHRWQQQQQRVPLVLRKLRNVWFIAHSDRKGRVSHSNNNSLLLASTQGIYRKKSIGSQLNSGCFRWAKCGGSIVIYKDFDWLVGGIFSLDWFRIYNGI